ncbi:MAG: filamentous hemagglutinin N-terminal domain-containing protein, partial [Phycisphaerae bacterium]|nr:filamentous hemagglutinin N-terminal domain-containing protein [Phycisphaerae bacterium]
MIRSPKHNIHQFKQGLSFVMSQSIAKRRLLLSSASLLTLLVATPAMAQTVSGLRGMAGSSTQTGGAGGSATGGTITTTVPTIAQSALNRQNAIKARVATAQDLAQQAQTAARTAALAKVSTIPDGLAIGGLVVDPRVAAGTDPNLWVNASQPTQTTSNGQTTVTITQTSQRAILTWQSFNVGKSTTVDFDQSGGNSKNGNNWVALNRIDAAGSPSQILGRIKADGTVLLINPNGIIFNGTSQVNVHSLIASSLDLNSQSGPSAFSGAPTYVPVMVNGVAQSTADGTLILAPPGEDAANTTFISQGLFPTNQVVVAAIFSLGAVPGQTNAGITVQPGAQITTSILGFDNGGYVALAGPSVINGGAITTSSGQIILAAANDVVLSEPASGTTISVTQVPPNGIGGGFAQTYFPAALTTPALTENDGILTSKDGAVTLVGDNLIQNGVIEATTSVNRAANLSFFANTLLTFTPDSVTTILPDENGETIPTNSTSVFTPPSIVIGAANVDLQGSAGGQSGALIYAPGAGVSISPQGTGTNTFAAPPVASQVFLGSGSVIDLSGLDATASAADYLYTFKVTANDVADTPLAQNLIGQTVTINLLQSGVRADGTAWVGSPLFSASGLGYLGDVPKTIDQLLTRGGRLSIGGGNYDPFAQVLQQSGSTINVSGGQIAFAGAPLNTTNLLATNGQVYGIGDADPTLTYVGLAGTFVENHPRWGISQSYSSPLVSRGYYQPSYIDGVSAGGLSIMAAYPVLEGTLLANATTSERQALLAQSDTGTGGTQTTPDELPTGGSLSITITTPQGVNPPPTPTVLLQSQAADILDPGAFTPDFVNGSMLNFKTTVSYPTTYDPNGNLLTVAYPQLVYSTDALSAAGFHAITLKTLAPVSMAKGAVLSVAPGGSVSLDNVDTIDGTINAPAGKITLVGYAETGQSVTNAPPVAQVTIGPDAVLNVAGLWVNDFDAVTSGAAAQGPAFINGGSVTIQTNSDSTTKPIPGNPFSPFVDTTQSIVLAPGSVIDVSSGGYVGTNGRLKPAANGLPAGNGGSLTLLTYAGPGYGSERYVDFFGNSTYLPQPGAAPNFGNEPTAANIFLGGTIYSSGLAQGGTFTLQAPTIQIGGVSQITPITTGAQAGTLALPASFFASNGFSSYALTSVYGGTTITAGTQVVLQQQNYLIAGGGLLPATGTRVRDFATLGLAPLGERQPVNLTLTQTSYLLAYDDPLAGLSFGPATHAGLLLDTGAAILGEPGARISLSAGGPLTILGRITAHGGGISLTDGGVPQDFSLITSGPPITVDNPAADLWIGSNAVLDVSGVFVPNPLVPGYRTGSVLAGGSISLDGGTIVALPGSVFDIAGASATVQTPNLAGALTGSPIVDQTIWSNGGSLTIGAKTP